MYNKDDNRITEAAGTIELVFSLFKATNELNSMYREYKTKTRTESGGGDGETIDPTILEKMGGGLKGRITIDDDYIVIKGINFFKFIGRIKEYYSENNFSKIFMKVYTHKSEKLWKKGKIRKKDMQIKELKFPVFFSLEIAMILEDLGRQYKVPYYMKMAKMIRHKTWVKNLDKPVENIPIDLSALKEIKYTLKPYQRDFIEMYPTLKNRFNLNGYILSFDQGLGKTLTAVSLAECLHKDQVVIVCPNSLKENWAYEIKEYFYKYANNEQLWRDEVYVHGSKKYSLSQKTKYVIVNLEAIPAIYSAVKPDKNTIIIVDEMHNVRNMKGKRTLELLELKKRIKNPDVLLMSGTPIKALPNEIIPSLMMIDPLFTDEVADIYNKCFNVDGTCTKDIVNTRFGIIMHRKTKKEVLQLPEKRLHILSFRLSNSNKYLSDVVKEDVRTVFNQLYNQELQNGQNLKDNYIRLVNKYNKAPRDEYKLYMRYVENPNDADYSEVDLENIKNFSNKYIKPNIIYPPDVKEFKEAETAYMRMEQRAMGRAIGQILHPRRTEMFIQLYEQNKEEIIDMINNATKKTVIFSTLLEIVNYISKDLEAHGIKNVKIVGGSGDRMQLIQKFKNDEDIEVLIATSQTLSTGVTLTEANQMFFFGTPWRSADYNQCCDRIYRIGQNTDVDIYNVLLDTGSDLNLSTRMNEILNWSDEMFNNMVEGENSNERL